MRVLISIDMEGVAGIATRRQVVRGESDYGLGRALMTAEANAAAAGAFDAGATEVTVADSHGGMDNLLAEELDPRVIHVLGSPRPLGMVEQVQTRPDLLFFVGYHAGPGSSAGVLAHSYSTAAFTDVRLNGASVTEAEIGALVAGVYGVPVGLVTGDEEICSVAEHFLDDAVMVPVKSSLSRTAARSLSPDTARLAIKDGAATAVRRAKALQPLASPDVLTLEVDIRPPDGAPLAALLPGTTTVGARCVRREMRDAVELVQIMTAWAHLAMAAN